MAIEEKKVIDPAILKIAAKVVAKRAKTVIDHIIKYGYISNEDLKETYGYDHPPRAARDVREAGIPLETFYLESKSGRRMGAYRFADISSVSQHKLAGRRTFSKHFKQVLLERDGQRCSLCFEQYEDRYLTIDHRVPYEVAGDNIAEELEPQKYMLVCGTCQRKKSWSCEQCVNWTTNKVIGICQTCLWASPENYNHLALKQHRRIELVWSNDDEVNNFEKLLVEAKLLGISLQEMLKNKLK